MARIWDVSLRDKAHSWNEYVHRVWPGSDYAFFLDGYTQVMPDAFEQLRSSLIESPIALAASEGRPAHRLGRAPQSAGSLSGNLHALRAGAMLEFRKHKVRLPLGIYRVDSLCGAIINFGFDPERHTWNPDKIVINDRASWKMRVKSPWRVGDLRDQYIRMKRQARGLIENRAFRDHLAVNRKPPATLPATARELCISWIRNHRREVIWLALKNPLVVDALLKLRRSPDWSQKDRPPTLIVTANV